MLRLLLEEARNELSFELSFLLVLSFALRGLSLGTLSWFSSLLKNYFPAKNSNLTRNGEEHHPMM